MVLIGGPKRPLPLHAKGIACNERNYDETLTSTKPAKHTESSRFYHKRFIFIHPLPTHAGIVTFRHTWIILTLRWKFFTLFRTQVFKCRFYSEGIIQKKKKSTAGRVDVILQTLQISSSLLKMVRFCNILKFPLHLAIFYPLKASFLANYTCMAKTNWCDISPHKTKMAKQ